VTYRIGQDSAHNGTAIFSGSDTWLGGSLTNLVLSGDAGDGKQHFATSGFTTLAWSYSGPSNLRISYVDFGKVASNGGNPEDFVFLDPVSAFEFDHNYVYMTSPTANAFGYFQFKGTSWDESSIHDNTIYTPHAAMDPGQGSDGIETGSSTGYSIYDNTLVSYGNAYTGGQHADGWQDTGGSSYIKIYGNRILNYGNFALYGDPTFGPLAHVWVYNNVVMDSDPYVQAGSSGGIIFGTDGGLTTGSTSFDDIVIANNMGVDYLKQQAAFALNNHTSFPTTFTKCVMANNITVNSSAVDHGIDMIGNSSTPLVDDVSLSATQAASMFVSYVPNGGLKNDFHLSAMATALLGKGANESQYFTTDLDGNARPATGPWDVGPYEKCHGTACVPVVDAGVGKDAAPPARDAGRRARDAAPSRPPVYDDAGPDGGSTPSKPEATMAGGCTVQGGSRSGEGTAAASTVLLGLCCIVVRKRRPRR
jgi:hypothetical protein